MEDIQTELDQSYPVNMLRNVALDGVETTYLLPNIDIDFVTSDGAQEDLCELIQDENSMSVNRWTIGRCWSSGPLKPQSWGPRESPLHPPVVGRLYLNKSL